MGGRRCRRALAAALVAATASLAAASDAGSTSSPGRWATIRVSKLDARAGERPSSYGIVLSPGGRFAAFTTGPAIYVRDGVTGGLRTVRYTTGGDLTPLSISSDGRFLVYADHYYVDDDVDT